MEDSYKEKGYCVGGFAHGIFCCIWASCSDKRSMITAGGGDINFEILSLLFINISLCAFSADVPVTRSVTVSNELHSPLHFIYWTDPFFTPIWSFTSVTSGCVFGSVYLLVIFCEQDYWSRLTPCVSHSLLCSYMLGLQVTSVWRNLPCAAQPQSGSWTGTWLLIIITQLGSWLPPMLLFNNIKII